MVGAWRGGGCGRDVHLLSGSSFKVTRESKIKQWWVRGRGGGGGCGRDVHLLSGSSFKVTRESKIKQWWVRGRGGGLWKGCTSFLRFLFQSD